MTDEYGSFKPWKIIVPAVLLIGLLVGVLLYYYLALDPYVRAENTMLSGQLHIVEQQDGTMTLTWPAGRNADVYTVEILRSRGTGKEVVWSGTFDAPYCTLPSLPAYDELTFRISSGCYYTSAGQEKLREGTDILSVTCYGDIPGFEGLTTDVDPNKDTLTVTWDGARDCIYTVYDEQGEVLMETYDDRVVLSFGEDGLLPEMEKYEVRSFTLTLRRESRGITFETSRRATFSITGEDLLDTELHLKVTDQGYNRYTLSWNESAGDHYELQEMTSSGAWRTIALFSAGDELSYTLGPLDPFTDYGYRVAVTAVSGLVNGEFEITPSTVYFSTGAKLLYARMWVLKDLSVYSDTSKTTVIGKATVSESFSILGEKDGMFLIRCTGGLGYVDSTFCLINLPDYLGTLCAYDIVNSYDAIYMVNEYGIPGITGTVITGYEQVRMEGVAPVDTYLAPILYPTAQKIAAAAQEAKSRGYRLKIYDTYRPWIATRFLYDHTNALLNEYLPEDFYSAMSPAKWSAYESDVMLRVFGQVYDESTGKWVSAGTQEPEDPDPEEEYDPNASGEGSIGALPSSGSTTTSPSVNKQKITYYTLMTNSGKYALSAFLARSGSYHNQGIAVDLTLERIDSGAELSMQTSLHDLSWYSVISLNNNSADLLADIMTGSGLATLSSEWWHFQDDELRYSTTGLVNRQNGLVRAGWRTDGVGWRYETEDGTYLRNGTYTIGGVSYDFDLSGYADSYGDDSDFLF